MQDKINDLKAQIGVSTNPTTPYARGHVWQFLLPGESTFESFIEVAHCLFAIIAGLLGAIVATRFHVRGQRRGPITVASGVNGSGNTGNSF